MSADDITISGGRYWSAKLHGDEHPRKVGALLKCDHGTYTATVDGVAGVLTIATDGYWFTEAERQPDLRTLEPLTPQPPPSAAELLARCQRLRDLCNEWLRIDDWRDGDIAPLDLVARTRAELARCNPALSPAKPGAPAATPATDPEAPAHAS